MDENWNEWNFEVCQAIWICDKKKLNFQNKTPHTDWSLPHINYT